MTAVDYDLGCKLSVEDWTWLNRTGIFENPELRKFVCPFPSSKLMYRVSGLENERDFASHGADLFLAISQASPIALTEYKKVLDFGCGCGRLARMFKNWPHELYGCDIDTRHVDWINENLKFMEATYSFVRPPLPYSESSFDAIISVSVFTHLNELSQDLFLADLHRVSRSGARLFLTVHGSRALERALAEEGVQTLISVNEKLFKQARTHFQEGKHAFILQQNYLTTLRWRLKNLLMRLAEKPNNPLQKLLEYGITFTPESYIRSHWTRWFEIQDFRPAAIHDFQDIVVLSPKK